MLLKKRYFQSYAPYVFNAFSSNFYVCYLFEEGNYKSPNLNNMLIWMVIKNQKLKLIVSFASLHFVPLILQLVLPKYFGKIVILEVGL